jgi:chromosomal replication initiation ATPase DnaA
MTTAAEILHNYNIIRERLIHPPNAIPDIGINLKRKNIQLPKDKPNLSVVVTVIEHRPWSRQPLKPKKLLFSRILEVVAGFHNISVGDLTGRSRCIKIAIARHIAIYLAYKWERMSASVIGRELGRDHTTCLSSRDRIVRLVAVDDNMKERIAIIEEILFKNN